MKKLTVIFDGIDSWNRPIFREISSSLTYIGDTGHLFDENATEDEVLKFYEDLELNKHLTYFGNTFGCEPDGGSLEDYNITLVNSSMKFIKVWLIEPQYKRISNVLLHSCDNEDSFLRSMYNALQCDMVEVGRNCLQFLPSNPSDDLWFDEEAGLREYDDGYYTFQLPNCVPIIGKGLIVGYDDMGECIDTTLTIEDANELSKAIRYDYVK